MEPRGNPRRYPQESRTRLEIWKPSRTKIEIPTGQPVEQRSTSKRAQRASNLVPRLRRIEGDSQAGLKHSRSHPGERTILGRQARIRQLQSAPGPDLGARMRCVADNRACRVLLLAQPLAKGPDCRASCRSTKRAGFRRGFGTGETRYRCQPFRSIPRSDRKIHRLIHKRAV